MIRVGYLYGKFMDQQGVKVEVIYEPPQDTTDVAFTLLEDPKTVSLNRLILLANHVTKSCVLCQ
jgi:hypothetical protein